MWIDDNELCCSAETRFDVIVGLMVQRRMRGVVENHESFSTTPHGHFEVQSIYDGQLLLRSHTLIRLNTILIVDILHGGDGCHCHCGRDCE